MRALEEIKTLNLVGIREFIHLDSGIAIYNISYNEKDGMTNLKSIISWNDDKFSDNINYFPPTTETVIIICENIYLTYTVTIVAEFINSMNELIQEEKFFFCIKFPNISQRLNASDKKQCI